MYTNNLYVYAFLQNNKKKTSNEYAFLSTSLKFYFDSFQGDFLCNILKFAYMDGIPITTVV